MSSAKPKFTAGDLKSAQRLSVILHKIGHEIGNPLTSIISLASLLERAAELPSGMLSDRLPSYGKNISSEAWRVAALNEKLVLLFSERSGPSEQAGVTEIIQRARRIVDRKLHREVEVDNRVQSSAEICCDLELSSWVLYALIENAVVHGTSVPEIRLEDSSEDDSIRIIVANSIEQPIDELEDLFEPFTVLDQHLKRTGLGLTVAAAVAERIGGAIELRLKSTNSGVSTFESVLSLPRKRNSSDDQEDSHLTNFNSSQSALNREKALGNEVQTKSALRIAIVEDEATVGSAIQKILRLGFQNKCAPTIEILAGEDFLAALHSGVSFDAILCDMNLGNVQGADILKEISRVAPELLTRFALLSGDRLDPSTLQELSKHGVHFLQKPFEAPELIALVTRLARL